MVEYIACYSMDSAGRLVIPRESRREAAIERTRRSTSGGVMASSRSNRSRAR